MKVLYVIKLTAISILLVSMSSFASTEPTLQNFVSTEPIETAAGSAHLEVVSFDIQNSNDIKVAEQEVLDKLKADGPTDSFFKLKVQSDGYTQINLQQELEKTAQHIEAAVDTKNILKPKLIKVDKPQGSFFKKNYNLTLTFVRFVANSATVTAGLIVGTHVPHSHATMIGILAGALSGAVQLKSDAVFKWLSNSVYLVNSAKKLGLIKNNDSPEMAEKVLREVEMYGRWATLETAFLVICRTAMSLLNIPVHENLFLTVGKSTLSQGIYEIGILKAAKALEEINPKWADKTTVFKNVSMFGGSAISVLAAIGSMINMPYANLGFALLTGTGVILNFSPKFMKLRPVEKILEKWRPRAIHFRCESLFAPT